MSLPLSLSESNSAYIIGIDLAWGTTRPDGVCLLRANRSEAEIVLTDLIFGDKALMAWLNENIPANVPALLAIDAPLIVPNATGSRRVDKQISSTFMKYHAACHSANSSRCVRPLQVVQLLHKAGFIIDYDLRHSSHIAMEVYPHPAIIRMFELDRIVKYKKGVITEKRKEFDRLQNLLRTYLKTRCPSVAIAENVDATLGASWSKGQEDRIDALICALIGYSHWLGGGILSEIAGSIEEGFIVLPPATRSGFTLMQSTKAKAEHSAVTMELVNRLRDED